MFEFCKIVQATIRFAYALLEKRLDFLDLEKTPDIINIYMYIYIYIYIYNIYLVYTIYINVLYV